MNRTERRRENRGQRRQERRGWIAQCLCPQRHCILANAGEADNRSAAEAAVTAPLRENITALLATGAWNPWCGLCNSPVDTWTYELGRTRYSSMEEATPELKQVESDNMLTRALWGDLHLRQRPN